MVETLHQFCLSTVELLLGLLTFRVMTKRRNRSVSLCMILYYLSSLRHNRLNPHLGSKPHSWVRTVEVSDTF